MYMTSFSSCSYRSTSNPNQNLGVWMLSIDINCTIILNLRHPSYEEKNPWYSHKTFSLSVNTLSLFIFRIHDIHIRCCLSLWIPWTYLSFGPIEVNLISLILFTSANFHCTYFAVPITRILTKHKMKKEINWQ